MLLERHGFGRVLFCQAVALLSLWLAVAVPVACHHAAPEPLLPMAVWGHGHAGAPAQGPTNPSLDSHDCAPHVAPQVPEPIHWLTSACGVLTALVPIGGNALAGRMSAFRALPAPIVLVATLDPPPRFVLPAA